MLDCLIPSPSPPPSLRELLRKAFHDLRRLLIEIQAPQHSTQGPLPRFHSHPKTKQYQPRRVLCTQAVLCASAILLFFCLPSAYSPTLCSGTVVDICHLLSVAYFPMRKSILSHCTDGRVTALACLSLPFRRELRGSNPSLISLQFQQGGR